MAVTRTDDRSRPRLTMGAAEILDRPPPERLVESQPRSRVERDPVVFTPLVGADSVSFPKTADSRANHCPPGV